MSDSPERAMAEQATSVEVLLVRMEGKMDRIIDRMERYENDHSALRQRVHDLNNDITPILLLDLPGRIRTADQSAAKIEARLAAIEKIETQREGAAKLAKLLWAVMGVVGVGGVAAVVRLFQIGGLG